MHRTKKLLLSLSCFDVIRPQRPLPRADEDDDYEGEEKKKKKRNVEHFIASFGEGSKEWLLDKGNGCCSRASRESTKVFQFFVFNRGEARKKRSGVLSFLSFISDRTTKNDLLHWRKPEARSFVLLTLQLRKVKGSEVAHFIAIFIVMTRFETSFTQQTWIIGYQWRITNQPFGVENVAEKTIGESSVILHAAQGIQTKENWRKANCLNEGNGSCLLDIVTLVGFE